MTVAGGAAGAAGDDHARFLSRLDQSLADASFVKLVLAKPRGAEPGLERVQVRRIVLRGVDSLSFVYRHTTRDITKNLALADAVLLVTQLLGATFRNAHLATRSDELQLAFNKKGQAHLSTTPTVPLAGAAAQPVTAMAPPGAGHDREKQRWLDLHSPFLVALGVTTAQHQLIPAMARKWKQINKFIEVFAGALAASGLARAGQPPIHVVDFGSGKGYLTFAVHDWLRRTQAAPAQVAGVELRADMVSLGNDAVAALGLDGLRFEAGDVRTWRPAALNVMIALHACDTATDHAIHLGVRAGASIIMCSPCCHKQLRPQLLSPHPLRPLLQHGVHQAQQAEMLTDGLRAMLLDACGYDTQIFEFVALEHTNKNKMILAVKRSQPRGAGPLLAQVADLKQFYGIRDQCLETLLRADGLLGEPMSEVQADVATVDAVG